MNEYKVVVEVSVLGEVLEVEVSVDAHDEDDARYAAESSVRDNLLVFAGEPEKEE